MIIGYTSTGYSHKRNIIGKLEEAQYIRVRDIFWLASATASRLTRFSGGRISFEDLETRFQDFGFNKADVLHFFNTISFGRTPWVSTFETIIPRFRSTRTCHWGKNPDFSRLKNDLLVRKGLEAISKPSCRSIIAMSRCNAAMQAELLKHFPEYKEIIEKKLVVLPPPQPLLISSEQIKEPRTSENIRFTFSGANFFRKGGGEIIETFEHLHKSYSYPIHLTIISALDKADYARQGSTEDVQKAVRLIQDNSSWIRWIKYLPYEELLPLVVQAHVGLLPTYADTYGYAALEFQAAGVPVISTDVRALPEINSDAAGWVIPVPKNRLGEAVYDTGEDLEIISACIRKGLEKAVHEIFADRSVIGRKSHAALSGIAARHSPADYAEKIRKIYLESSGR